MNTAEKLNRMAEFDPLRRAILTDAADELSALTTQLQAAQASIAEALSYYEDGAPESAARLLRRIDTSALAEHNRKVKARAWDEGYWQGINGHTGAGNPYRDSGATPPASIEQEGAE